MDNKELTTNPEQNIGGLLVDSAARVLRERSTGLNDARKQLLTRINSPLTRTARAALVAGVLLAAGCGNNEEQKHIDIPPTPISTIEPKKTSTPIREATPFTPTPEAKKDPPKEVDRHRQVGSIAVEQDIRGLPVSYKLPDGKVVRLVPERVKEVRQKAIDTHEPEILEVVNIPDKPTQPEAQNLKDRPVLTELPKDVMSQEELSAKGVKIINSDKVQLFIRRGAFEKGGPMEGYQKGKDDMTIALLDGPFISDMFMHDPKYAAVRAEYLTGGLRNEKPIEVDTKKYRADEIAKLKGHIDQVRKINKEGGDKTTLLNLKYRLHSFENMSEPELLARFRQSMAVGEPGGIILGSSIIIATGKNEISNKAAVLAFDDKGQLIVSESLQQGGLDSEPKEHHSAPRPSDFPVRPNLPADNRSYKYDKGTPGFTLLHEIGHELLTTGQQRKLRGRESEFLDQNGQLDISKYINAIREDFSELGADEKAMEFITAGYKKWVESGYKDDSGYFFVFKLPNGKYIVSKNTQQTEDKTQPVT